MKIDPSEQPNAVYRTLSSLVVPRPIGWISTVSSDGQPNLAPYSYFNAVSSSPPTVMFSASNSNGELKDSPRNAIDTGEFVQNIVTSDLVEDMDLTSEPTDKIEFEHADIEMEKAETVDPPRVADAKAALECEVVDCLEIGQNSLIFGRVKQFHVDDSLVTDGDVDAAKIDSVGRLGGPYYTDTNLLEFTRQY